MFKTKYEYRVIVEYTVSDDISQAKVWTWHKESPKDQEKYSKQFFDYIKNLAESKATLVDSIGYIREIKEISLERKPLKKEKPTKAYNLNSNEWITIVPIADDTYREYRRVK